MTKPKPRGPVFGDRVTVQAVKGRKVLDEKGQPITTEGARVTLNHYYHRLAKDGDVVLAEAEKGKAKEKN